MHTNSSNHSNLPPIDKNRPDDLHIATFALGWFWGPDAQFGSLKGVYRTIVGYSGGVKDNPTYHDLGNHSEAIQIYYNPLEITYEELLDVFWKKHNPFREPWSSEYASILFYHEENQEQVAIDSKDKIEEENRQKVYTEIIPYNKFYQAENYHQKYYLQLTKELLKEFREIYSNFEDFINSTSGARVNGYIKGCGNTKRLEQELGELGLSPKAQKRIKEIFAGYGK